MTTMAHEIELEPLAELESKHNGKPALGTVLPFLGAVKVRVAVQVGGVDLSVAELMAMKQGAVLALDRLVEQPLDVLVDAHVVARGVLVAVGEHFGVRITEAATVAQGLAAAEPASAGRGRP